MVVIGDKIKKIRELRALSQKEVASLADIDRGQYSRIETNKVEPSLSTVKKIALALQVDVEDFFKKESPVTVDSFDKTLVEKVKMIDELEIEQKSHIFAIIDMAVSNNRLKNTLTKALQVNF
jgi:transcriptional regulator with XRE-family HTH domain